MISVNGRNLQLDAEVLAELLATLGYAPTQAGIAVAVNGAVVPRDRWAAHALRAGDAVEIVGAVQGG
ncbi:MAG TPA: sulfur carrier protein ThiS [Candidatus Polarisedimenticolaceae bacterium]|nr:sulfur carrier protein ThiS [Candidatus Polarisedimenticolaceae bacterium]